MIEANKPEVKASQADKQLAQLGGGKDLSARKWMGAKFECTALKGAVAGGGGAKFECKEFSPAKHIFSTYGAISYFFNLNIRCTHEVCMQTYS